MDLEQLKLILGTLEKLGDAGKWAFMWYVIVEMVGKILSFAFGGEPHCCIV